MSAVDTLSAKLEARLAPPRDPDTLMFAATLMLASPALRAEILAELRRTCERAGLVASMGGVRS